MSLDDGTTLDIGTSSNVLYVAYQEPTVDNLYLTLVHIGCEAAAGLVSEQSVFDAIWGEFAGLEVHQVEFDESSGDVNDRRKLTYWANPNFLNPPDAPPRGRTTAELLTFGDGVCEGWSNFFIDVLAAQGISATELPITAPDFPNHGNHVITDERLVIKNWDYDGAEMIETYIYDLYELNSMTPGVGVPAQGNPNPIPKIFNAHSVVVYDGKRWDVSYGKGGFDDVNAWVASQLSGYVMKVTINGVEKGDYVVKMEN